MRQSIHPVQNRSSSNHNAIRRGVTKETPFFGRTAEHGFFQPAAKVQHRPVQTKLTVGQSGDKYETEADAMADKVVQQLKESDTIQAQPLSLTSSITPVLQPKCTACEEEKLQNKEEEEKLQDPGMEVQRKTEFAALPDPPQDENNNSKLLKCSECEKEEKIQKTASREKEGVPALMAKSTEKIQTDFSGLESQLSGSRGSGSPLPETTRSSMESAFGTDFSKVKIHTGSQAAAMNKSLHAQAFTHGSDIYFNEGKYNPDTMAGKHLLAHELTHTVQQGATPKQLDKKPLPVNRTSPPDIQRLAPFIVIGGGILGRYLLGRGIRWGIRKWFEEDKPIKDALQDMLKQLRGIPLDIRGMAAFHPTAILKDYIQSYRYVADFLKDYGLSSGIVDEYAKGPKINLKYGSMGKVNGVRVRWDSDSGTYHMAPYQMALVHKDFNFFDKAGKTLGMNIRIKNSVISGEAGVAPLSQFFGHLANSALHDAPSDFTFNPDLLEDALLGDDANNATPAVIYGILAGGYIDMMYSGFIDIQNFQYIIAFYHLHDQQGKSEWDAYSDLDVMGMQPFKLNILRTAKGILSGMMGEGEKILFADSVKTKGFKAITEIKASYLNQTLIIQGTGSFETKRAKGNLFFIVTDYTTAKNHALNFLTDLEASGPVEEGPPNPSERLAFMASGNLTFTLFDGKTENRKKSVGQKLKGFIMDDPEPGKAEIPPLQADAAFVVEPEGFITISGQVAPRQKSFNLTEEQKYEKEVELADWPFGTLPLPYGLGISFKFNVKAFAGAFLEPIKLSDIFAEGVYSTNPRFPGELRLGAKLSVNGGVKVGIRFCLSIEAGTIGNLITLTLIEKCIEGAVGMSGGVQAEPTIQIQKTKPDEKNLAPPEYFIKGNLHFSSGGVLTAKLGDTLAIKVKDIEKEEDKGTRPLKTWHYKNSEKTADKKFGDRSLIAPLDLTLGSGEPPPVSLPKFSKAGTWTLLNSVIGGRKGFKNYFEEKESTVPDPTKPKGPDQPDDTEFKSGGFEEGREEKGELIKEPTATPDEETSYTFEEEFTMLMNLHKLILHLTQKKKSGQVEVDSKLLMKSQTEPLAEKIEEEKKELNYSTGPEKTIRQQDIAVIERQAEHVKEDANKLGVNEQVTNETRIGGLKETAESISQYGDRHNESDLGAEETIPDPKCEKPPLNPEDDVFFPERKDKNNLGKVIEIKKDPVLLNGKTVGYKWLIVFKPKNKRTTISVMNPAYDENCKPLFVKPEPEGCENANIVPLQTITVPGRTIDGKKYPGGKKAKKVKAYPLCWGKEQKPNSNVIGWVRIHKDHSKKWHRTHLIHGKMGGSGSSWNLVPAPQFVNNSEMRSKFENKLLNSVISGLNTGTYYWLSAEVFYHDNSVNPTIGHFDDFVKKIEVQYGEANKDSDGKWHFADEGIIKATIENGFAGEPDNNELAPDRKKG